MVELKWIITDEFIGRKGNENYSVNDFPYVDGYFEMTLNQRWWGVFPKIAESWNGTFVKVFPPGGDSLMELFQCFSRVVSLKANQQYLFRPMDIPLISLLFYRETDTLRISQQRDEKEISRILHKNPKWLPPECWTEIVAFDEFSLAVKENIQQFLKTIGDENPDLLNNKFLKEIRI